MASLQKPSSEGSSDSGCCCQENKRLPQVLGFGPVSHNPITDRLKHMEMSQLATKNVLTVTTHTSLQGATIKMVESFVSSAPVYDPQENRCIGTVNLLDIATYIASKVAPAGPREEKCHPKVELLNRSQ
jgi:signal-transduction protein with cAMP-binding, CBS, and nucleotidyltransferase domain